MVSREYESVPGGKWWQMQETEESKRRNAEWDEERKFSRQFRAKGARRLAVLVAVVIGLLPAILMFALWRAPEEPDPVETVAEAPPAFVDDPDDLLSPDEELRLLDGADDLPHPSTVQQLRFIVFDDSLDNVNDSVENFMRDTYPDEIGDDTFADGVILVGAAMKTRHQFIFAGKDVASQLALRSGSHLDRSLAAMKDGLASGDIPRGLLDGARVAMDPEEVASRNDSSFLGYLTAIPTGFGLFAAALAVGFVPVKRIERRKQRIAEARLDRQKLIDAHSSLALRLSELDLRAHSLSSRFANGELRQEWEEVRDRFLAIDDAVAHLPVDTDSDALANWEQLHDAAATVKDVEQAEENINLLFRMEQGDVNVRAERLRALRADAVDAGKKAKDSHLKAGLQDIVNRLDAMAKDPANPAFMDAFMRLLADYRILMDVLQKQQFTARKGVKDPRAPHLWERDYAYPGVYTYATLSLWNNTTNSPSSSSGGTNSGFSSGFSGSGGSSSF